jgi:CheY-like chemotaxis protein
VPVAVLCECGADGTVLRELRQHFPLGQNGEKRCAIIAIGPPDVAPTAAELGADLFLPIPLEKDILTELRRLTKRRRPCKLLLVEDNDISLYILRELLDRPWLSLLEARNGEEALEAVSRELPDAVILDLLMPGMDGFEVLRRLRAREEFSELPVIVCTSKKLTHEDTVRLENMHVGVISKADIASRLAPELLLKSLAELGIAEPRSI